jgi:nucleoside-diphosphate-sugar epimerase
VTHFLVGARGRLGQAIAHEYADNEIVSLDRSIYENWSQPGVADQVSRYFDKCSMEGATVFVASGLLDPKLSREDLLRVNYHLPKNLIDGAAKLGIKIITFGTVMEGLLQSKNPYIQTKIELAEYISTAAATGSPVIHLQIHTLYGVGQPSPFMFLGQVLATIRDNVQFKMTSGRQLREYHHLVDEAKAIRKIADSALSGIVNVSHGEPLTLKIIADGVFQALGRDDLLRVGALPEPPEENYEKILNPTEMLQQVAFRDSLPAIIQYMKECHSFQKECDNREI